MGSKPLLHGFRQTHQSRRCSRPTQLCCQDEGRDDLVRVRTVEVVGKGLERVSGTPPRVQPIDQSLQGIVQHLRRLMPSGTDGVQDGLAGGRGATEQTHPPFQPSEQLQVAIGFVGQEFGKGDDEDRYACHEHDPPGQQRHRCPQGQSYDEAPTKPSRDVDQSFFHRCPQPCGQLCGLCVDRAQSPHEQRSPSGDHDTQQSRNDPVHSTPPTRGSN